MNDYAETRQRLERTAAGIQHTPLSHVSFQINLTECSANHWGSCSEGFCGLPAELHGPGRVAGLRRWISIMQALSTPPHQPLYMSTVSSSEGDWQKLTQVTFDVLVSMAGIVQLPQFRFSSSLEKQSVVAAPCCNAFWLPIWLSIQTKKRQAKFLHAALINTALLRSRLTTQVRQGQKPSWPCRQMKCGLWMPLVGSHSPSGRSSSRVKPWSTSWQVMIGSCHTTPRYCFLHTTSDILLRM